MGRATQHRQLMQAQGKEPIIKSLHASYHTLKHLTGALHWLLQAPQSTSCSLHAPAAGPGNVAYVNHIAIQTPDIVYTGCLARSNMILLSALLCRMGALVSACCC